MRKVKKVFRAVVILLLGVGVVFPCTLVVAAVLSLLNWENPVSTWKEVDVHTGVKNLLTSFIPHIKSVIKYQGD